MVRRTRESARHVPADGAHRCRRAGGGMASAEKARARETAVASPKVPSAAPDVTPDSGTPQPSGHPLDTSLRFLPGVGPKRAERLDEGLGLRTVGDLLYRPPRRIEDRRTLHRIYDLTHGAVETVEGTVASIRAFRVRRRRNFVIVKAAVTDGTGVLHAVWYNQGYIVRQLPAGARVILHGRVQRQAGEIQMIAPVYRATEGVTQRVLRTMVMRALDEYAPSAVDWLPDELRDRYAFPALPGALRALHFPETEDEQTSAHGRLAYEELLLFQTCCCGTSRRGSGSQRA